MIDPSTAFSFSDWLILVNTYRVEGRFFELGRSMVLYQAWVNWLKFYVARDSWWAATEPEAEFNTLRYSRSDFVELIHFAEIAQGAVKGYQLKGGI